jgi:hypothetical protein
MKYIDLVSVVSKELNIPIKVVDRAYKSYWEFIKTTIQALPLKEDIDEEEFSKLRTNFNIPSLGKLVCTYDRMVGVKKRFNYIKKIREDAKD